jgi:1,4-dihydroxy-2-naphthoate octaprenyltransferase
MNKALTFIQSMRPKSLFAAICPVLIGTASARELQVVSGGSIQPVRSSVPIFGLCILVAVFLQLAANYANDYYDHISGVDKHRKKQSEDQKRPDLPVGVYRRRFMFNITLGSLCGIMLISLTSLPWLEKGILLVLGALALLAIWGYSGGKHPYGHKGLGELSSFVFFGLFATLGSFYVQTGSGGISNTYFGLWRPLIRAVSIGLVIAAMLMIDNLRDIKTDSAAGKITLMVRLGQRRSKILYIATISFAGFLAVLTMKINYLPIICAVFTVITILYQCVNIREEDYKKAFNFNCILGIALTLVLLF